MSKVIITLTDAEGGVQIELTGDSPGTVDPDKMQGAQYTAYLIMNMLNDIKEKESRG